MQERSLGLLRWDLVEQAPSVSLKTFVCFGELCDLVLHDQYEQCQLLSQGGSSPWSDSLPAGNFVLPPLSCLSNERWGNVPKTPSLQELAPYNQPAQPMGMELTPSEGARGASNTSPVQLMLRYWQLQLAPLWVKDGFPCLSSLLVHPCKTQVKI